MSAGLITALFALGLVLLILEIFVPGGILGLIGIVSLISAIIFASNSLLEGFLYSMLTLIGLAVLIFVSFRFPATRRYWERLSLTARQTNRAGYVAPKSDYQRYLGRNGIALTQLRPAGTAEFGDERVDVVTEGGFIKSGSAIKVISVEGTRIVVRESK
ncbi:MAG: NfeD family protein [Desulfitobacteriaceae bacterium]|nr:NfeD family protein [Desulfitobacteriaceae bacterium]MDI6915832.1 NfeD family protein [Desulfitobacteriaceae bacterium]